MTKTRNKKYAETRLEFELIKATYFENEINDLKKSYY